MIKKRINVKQIGSSIRRPKIQKAILKGLGLGRMNKIVNLEDTASIQGMIKKIPHLVKVI